MLSYVVMSRLQCERSLRPVNSLLFLQPEDQFVLSLSIMLNKCVRDAIDSNRVPSAVFRLCDDAA